MILTVTLNPALDRSIEVERVTLGDTNRVTQSRTEPGGKGINVSRALLPLGGASLALGFVAGSLGRSIEHALNDRGIRDDFIHIPGQTRTNTIVIDHAAQIHTTFAERGPAVDAHHLDDLHRRIRHHVSPGDWVVLSGSLPPGVAADAYARIIDQAKPAGARIALDADGEPLRLGVAARPDIIKPNRHELERLIGRTLNGDADILTAAREIQAGGIGRVIVSLGADGSIAIDETGAWRARSPKVEVNSAVGAGDSLVAGVLFALERGDPLPEAIRLGTACGAAAALTSGTELCYREDIDRLLPLVEIEAIG